MFPELVGNTPGLTKVRDQLARVIAQARGAGRLPPVLIQGETGTGKGLLARALHDASARGTGPFVDVNCAAIPAALLESEMFGFERGAFTDARQPKPGLFQTAAHGSIFLDEIGLLPEAMQGKLLKVIEERTVRRLGATRNETVDAWVIAATSEDLDTATREKRFRRDLYHRLAVVTVRLPPLRERGEDVLTLARHFLARSCAEYGHQPKGLSGEAQAALRAHDWPGNVRELANVMERAVLLSDSAEVGADALELPEGHGEPPEPEPPAVGSLLETLRGTERETLLQALQQTSWNLSRAAARLGLPRNTLLYRMERQGLRPPPPSRRRAPAAPAPPPADPTLPAHTTPGGPRRVALLRVELAGDAAQNDEAAAGRLLDAIAEKVNAFGGRVEGVATGHVVAVFGIEPVEDAPRRATLAALAAQKTAERVRRDGAASWSVRAAVHVADCAVGDAGGTALLDGDETREAWAALSAVARGTAPHGVSVSAAAARFLERRFELAPPAPGDGAGAAWRVSGPEGAGFALRGRTTAFTGRRHELALLESRLETARDGRGQVVAIVGGPGMGKSRLLSRFRQAVAGQPLTWLEGHCASYASATPYHAVLDVLRQACGISEGDGPPVVAEKVARALQDAGLAADDAPYLLNLVDSPAAAESLGHVGPEQLKSRTFEALRQVLIAPRGRPLILALEDLHWVDTTSDALIAELVQTVANAPVLLVVTYRPGYHAPWLARSYASQLSLAPLSGDDSLVVLRSALDRPLPPATLAVLAGRGDGNPFFLEELARAAAEQGEDAAAPAVPATIEGVLVARMDRLVPSDKRVLQAASVVGRDVPLSVLRATCGDPEAALRTSLDRLCAAEFLYEARLRIHTFKHSLTQEVAYGTLAAGERRQWHAQVADVLRQAGAEIGASRPETVARHLTAAGKAAEAIPYWLAAGRDATRRSANVEAVSHLKTALELLAGEPASAARDAAELELQLALGVPLIMTQGYASAEAESAFRRAEGLCAQMSQTPQLFSALWGVSLFHVVRGDLHSARAVAERLLSVATCSGRDDLRLEAHLAFGAALFHQGFLADAREHLRHCDALYDPARHADHAFLYGQDPLVAALGFLGRALLLLGEEAEAVRCIERALRRAEAIRHPFSQAFAQLNAAALYELLGDWRSVVPYTEQAITLATEHRFPYLLGGGIALRGQFLVSQGRYAEGLPLIQQGLDTWRATGATLSLPYYLGVTAAAHHAAGHAREGLPLIAEALAAVARSGEFISEPDLHRIHGELLAADPATESEAPAAFERARTLATAHGARLFDRRAVASFANYLRARGKDREAADLVRVEDDRGMP